MLKETIVCIVIVIGIILGNTTTQNYTKQSVEELSSELMHLRGNIEVEDVNNEKSKKEMEEIYKKWEGRHNILAYYIEHDELEKLETEMVGVKSYIETKQYEEAIGELDKSVFILKHIEDKYAFNLENVF